jgi:hypothetical protein
MQVALLFALTAIIGGLAGYGALRLWRDHAQPAPASPSVAQAAAPTAASAPASVTPPTVPAPSPPAQANKAASKQRPASRRSGRRTTAPAPSAPPPVSFASPDDVPAEPEPGPKAKESPPAANRTSPPAEGASLRAQYSVVVDLTRSRTQETIEIGAKELVPVGMTGCSEKFEIKPESIVIKGPREIVIDISYDRLSGGRLQVALEPTIMTDAGKKLPFTVRNIENIRRQIGQQGERAATQVAGWKAERESLDTYLKSAVTTPTRYNAARSRVEELKKLIPEANKQVAAMKVGFDTAEKMVALAKALTGKCAVLFEEKR